MNHLRDYLDNSAAVCLSWDRTEAACYTELAKKTSLGARLHDLEGRCVLLATDTQLAAALALIELDGFARRLVILPPGIEADHLNALIARAEIDAIVTDRGWTPPATLDLPVYIACGSSLTSIGETPVLRFRTEWVLLTSGTVGVPKMVAHDLSTLTAPIRAASPADGAGIWGTFYDIRRYGGVQIFLRAVLGGASLILSSAAESVADHLARLAKHGVTHLSGTPSHWRRALMNPAIRKIAPRYIRLSGEIADQAVLDTLRESFPRAAIGHAYASTEAGVAFDVNDGLAGFPTEYVGRNRNGVEMKIVDGSLRIRSTRLALGYIGTEQLLANSDGFVDTGDILERSGDRYYFVGRNDGIINVGGLKVHPEEVETVINRHPRVRMSLVRPMPSAVVGSIVIADVVLKQECQTGGTLQDQIRSEILDLCRNALPRHKVPIVISFVPNIQVAASGKLERRQPSA